MGKRAYNHISMNYTEVIDKGSWKDIKMKNVMVEIIHTKVYSSGIVKMHSLSPCAKLLLFFLADRMDEKGVIYSNKSVREDFAEYSATINKGTAYTDGTIFVALTELRKEEFLIEMGRGVMWVNPIYLWRGDEESRVVALQRIFKDKYKNLKVTLEK